MMTRIAAEHFKSDLSDDTARQLFKISVIDVEIGISSFCNRTCNYCPNGIVDRRSKQNFMSDGLFHNIMCHLSDIDYDGVVMIHRYNEPLANLDYALSRIRDIRAFVPRCSIKIHTNGDYLDRDAVHALRDAGVTHMEATVHSQPDVTEFNVVKQNLQSRLERLGLPSVYVHDSPTLLAARVDAGPNISFEYRATNFFHRDNSGSLSVMFDRGQSLHVSENYQRVSPCLAVFTQMQIEWDGRLQPCCNIHIDVPDHGKYLVGHITAESNIYQAWASETYVAWRQKMFSFDLKPPPCTTCKYFWPIEILDTIEMRKQVSNFRLLFGLSDHLT